MKSSLQSHDERDSSRDLEGEQPARYSDPIIVESDKDDRQADQLEADGSRGSCGEDVQDMGDCEFNDVGDSGTPVQEEADKFRAESMAVDQGVIAGAEEDTLERKAGQMEKEAVAEPGDSGWTTVDEAAGEVTAHAKSRSGENNVQTVRQQQRSKSPVDDSPASLPFTRVKRIIKLDPDIRLVSKEGLFAISQATQHFLEALAAESVSEAWKSKRKGVKADDILVAAKNPKFIDCLGTTVSDFVRHLREEDSEDEDGESAGEGDGDGVTADSKKGHKDPRRKFLHPPPGNRSITDFLKAAG